MKTIEETFKVEKEILEEFLKNREMIKGVFEEFNRQLGNESPGSYYGNFGYNGVIKNPRELNVKNTFDLLEYLKPFFVYFASEIKTFKEKLKEEHADSWEIYQNYYYFKIRLLLTHNSFAVEEWHTPIGFDRWGFKKEIYFYDSLNANEIKNYIENESRTQNITFLFNDKPVPFNFEAKTFRTDEYEQRLYAEWAAHINSHPGSESDDDTINKKRIIKAEQTFKEDECVICLTEPPNVLFCNCGHLCLCAECSKIECFEECPICKTENTIIRIIE